MPHLKLGWKASAEQFAPRRLLDYAVEAERLGFESAWVSDHFHPWRHTDGHAAFSPVWLAATGERSGRLTLGTSVLTPTFRYHPSVVAHAFASLGVMYPGRMVLGVGTGESMNEVSAIGIDWPDQRERFRRLSEAVKLIQRLWREEFVDFEGEYYRVRGATIYDKPEEPVPVFIAATGPAAAKLAGRIADGFICTSGKGIELYRDVLLPAVREGAEAAGRDYDSIEKMIEVKVSFDTDLDQAMEDTKIWAALALPGEVKADVHDPVEMEARSKEAEPYAHRRWLVSSDPEEQLEQVKTYLDLGFNHLVFHAPGDDQSRFLQLYAKEMLPRLRKL